LIKEVLFARFTASPLLHHHCRSCPLSVTTGPSALFAKMQALFPCDANILFHAMFLRRLLKSMQATLVD
jgi:hypothetical protein